MRKSSVVGWVCCCILYGMLAGYHVEYISGVQGSWMLAHDIHEVGVFVLCSVMGCDVSKRRVEDRKGQVCQSFKFPGSSGPTFKNVPYLPSSG